MQKFLCFLVILAIVFACSACFAESEKISIKVINNSDEAIGQQLARMIKDGIDQSGFCRLVITEPSKIDIVVSTKNKILPRKLAVLNNLEAKRFRGMTLSADNPYIQLANNYLSVDARAKLRIDAAKWESEHAGNQSNSISYSIVWNKKDGDNSIYIDTMMGFCEGNSMNLIVNDILTKTSSIIDKNL